MMQRETFVIDPEVCPSEGVVEKLDKFIIGQQEAKETIAETIGQAVNYILPKKGPLGVLLFVGPTGVGKTESVRALAELLTGNPELFTKINGEQFQEDHTVSRLFGAPPSYVGYNDPPILAQVADNINKFQKSNNKSPLVENIFGFNIILIDEVEKMHPKVIQALLGAFDDGQIRLSNGSLAILNSSLIIMTSNIGEREKREIRSRNTMGFVSSSTESDEKKAFEQSMKLFSPEMLGRIDKVVHFEDLTREDGLQIVRLLEDKVNDTLDDLCKPFKLCLSEEVIGLVLDTGFSKEKGARDISRAFRKLIDAPLARCIASLESKMDDIEEVKDIKLIIEGNLVGNKVVFSITKGNIVVINRVKSNVALLTLKP